MTVAIIVKGYPRLSETFIAQEILALQERGQAQIIVSLRRPTDRAVHAMHRRITAPVLYLPEYLHEAPGRVAAARLWARQQPGYAAAYAAFRRDLRRDPTTNRWRRFGQACVLAAELPESVHHLHIHYLHTPASVGRYAAMIRGLPFSLSAHAKDIWTTPEWEIREKLAESVWAVTCTALNARTLSRLAPRSGHVRLNYHGLDFSRFPAPPIRPPRDGSGAPIRFLSVGRAVEKKGFDLLLEALGRLPPSVAWRLEHIGGGPLLPALKRAAASFGGRIHWRGPQPQETVIAAMAEADLFVLAARRAADGDMDGLPNVLLEAQAMELAVLATDLSAIPELIDHGETGWLVPPEDPLALRDALLRLAGEPALRARLASAGAERVRARFNYAAGIERLAGLMASPTPAAC